MSRHPVRACLSDSNPPQSKATWSGEAHLRTCPRVSTTIQPPTSCVTSKSEGKGEGRGTHLRISPCDTHLARASVGQEKKLIIKALVARQAQATLVVAATGDSSCSCNRRL